VIAERWHVVAARARDPTGLDRTALGSLCSRLDRGRVRKLYCMKRSLIGVLVSVVAFVWSCSNDEPSTPSTAGAQHATSPDASADAKTPSGVECNHPGAGKALGGDRCECTTTLNIAGEWTTLRTCREGDSCPTKNKDDIVVFTQTGTSVRADKGGSYAMKGTLCGNVLVWSGGPTDGLNPECGTIRFTDDSHYITDSCYAESGECSRTHGDGCPGQKGQCTGTGAKKPEAAPKIQKLVCN
jgi:hypothetical protein